MELDAVSLSRLTGSQPMRFTTKIKLISLLIVLVPLVLATALVS
ncbi:hypothetical protein N4S66_10320 [Shewanella algae]|nr:MULTISPECIES: hypothetical protein [Shewanella]MCT8980878.1 hypothetical protein [Shewanella algae]MDE0567670.1 hypothetical protein [Shewanella sp. K8]